MDCCTTVFYTLLSCIPTCCEPSTEQKKVTITPEIISDSTNILHAIDPDLLDESAAQFTLQTLLAQWPDHTKEELTRYALLLCNAARNHDLYTLKTASGSGPIKIALSLIDETTCKKINEHTPIEHDRYYTRNQFWASVIAHTEEQCKTRRRAHTAPSSLSLPSRDSSDTLTSGYSSDSDRA